jgi:hypothetical protein
MSTAKFDTLSTLDGSQSVPVGTVAQGSAKAWVNFNGTGTVAIRAAFNVTSITDNGTGDYTLNFTTALPDANYAVAGMSPNFNTQNTLSLYATSNAGAGVVKTTSTVRVKNALATSYADTDDISVAIFR